MPRRIDLETELSVLSRHLGITLRLDKMVSGYRVELADGSRYLSPRLPARSMYDWLSGATTALAEVERLRSAT